MRVSIVAAVAVVVLVLVAAVPSCEAQELDDLVLAIGEKLLDLWRNEDIEFLGHQCKLTVKPKIRRFQLYHEGRMWCSGWTPIRGEASTRSFSGVAGKTVQDFARKALSSGLITEEDAQAWLTV